MHSLIWTYSHGLFELVKSELTHLTHIFRCDVSFIVGKCIMNLEFIKLYDVTVLLTRLK